MKVKIGNDEFCLYCMEWQEYDEEGRCKVCKHIIHIKKKESEKASYNDLKSEAPSFEMDEDNDNGDY